jgi:hypothetical protein
MDPGSSGIEKTITPRARWSFLLKETVRSRPRAMSPDRTVADVLDS